MIRPGVDYAGLEDPFLYRDRRGIFHAVFHNQIEDDDQRLCGGHAFSEDGKKWTFTGTAWSNRVPFDDGTHYAFSRRERSPPHYLRILPPPSNLYGAGPQLASLSS